MPVRSCEKAGEARRKRKAVRTICPIFFIQCEIKSQEDCGRIAGGLNLLILRLFMPDQIHITLPDGAVREYAKGTTALDVAKSISEGLARKVLAADVNGQVWDATRTI